jgi:hypothetical protein
MAAEPEMTMPVLFWRARNSVGEDTGKNRKRSLESRWRCYSSKTALQDLDVRESLILSRGDRVLKISQQTSSALLVG